MNQNFVNVMCALFAVALVIGALAFASQFERPLMRKSEWSCTKSVGNDCHQWTKK